MSIYAHMQLYIVKLIGMLIYIRIIKFKLKNS